MSRAMLWSLPLALALGCQRQGPAEGKPAPAPAAPSSAASSAPAAAPPSAPLSHQGPPPADVTLTPAIDPTPRPGFDRGPGPEACADCHPDHVEGFAKTGMGRALYRPQAQPPIEDFTPAKATVTHPKTGVRYRALIDADGRWWQEEALADGSYRRQVEVKFVIGSGNHTRSYIGEVEGELVELPLTWYSKRKIWDMSPGYEERNHHRFERPIKAECVFCHNGLSPVRDETHAGYQAPFAEGIGCERCHGNGQAHVTARLDGGGPPEGQPDPSIYNPGRAPLQRQLELCQQCHLQGETRILHAGERWDAYDPRRPLGDFMSIFVYAKAGGAEFSIASHGHRMSLSRCFTESAGKLTCTSCHDPHQPASAGKARHAACVGCHQPADCGDAHGAKEGADCARCHMNRGGTTDIPHVNFTDHFIRAKLEAEHTPAPATQLELVDALAPHRTRRVDPTEEAVRLGMAHEEVWRFQDKQAHAPEGMRRLMLALPQRPDHAGGWSALARLRKGLGDLRGAVEAYAQVVRHRPQAVLDRIEAATLSMHSGDRPGAERLLREALALRQDSRVAATELGNALHYQGRQAEADAWYAFAERLNPEQHITANNRGQNLMAMGQLDAARRWFEEAVRRDGLSPMGHYSLGSLALRLEDADGALRHFSAAVRVDDHFGPAYLARGRVYGFLGRSQDALHDLKRFTSLRPKDPLAWLELARIQAQQLQDLDGAARSLQEGLSHSRGEPQLSAALDRLRRRQPF